MKITENIYRLIESCLEELSDIEFQKRVWVRGEGPEVSSYSEAVCQLFDDTAIGDFLDDTENGVVLSEELDSLLRELSNILDLIDYRIGASNIIKHPHWPKVRQLAADALKALYKINYQ